MKTQPKHLKPAIVSMLLTVSGMAYSNDETITIIVNDPSNPFWFTEGHTAQIKAEELGYTTEVKAHQGSIENERQIIEQAIKNKSKAIILDPANTELTGKSVSLAKHNNIPVIIINAQIAATGLAHSQLVSDNTQCARLAAKSWSNAMKYSGEYIELVGASSDKNAAIRSAAFGSVLNSHTKLKRIATISADWSRLKSYQAIQQQIVAHPNLSGIISSNDEMALGAIQALQEAQKLDQVVVSGFDGSPDAATSILLDEMHFSVLQPVTTFAKEAVIQADNIIRNGSTGQNTEIQLFDCTLLSQDNVHLYQSAFELSTQ